MLKFAVITAVALVSIPAIAAGPTPTWYTTERGINCVVSDQSPAKVYEMNQAYGNARITDKGNDRVEVFAQGMSLNYFRTEQSCNNFVGQSVFDRLNREEAYDERMQKFR